MKPVLSICPRPVLAVCVLALAGCATNGVMQGRTAGQAVQLHYHHSFWNQNGVLDVVMPNGESFSGKFVIGTSSSTGLALGTKSDNTAVVSTSGNTSRAAAVLMGNKGDSMHCTFQLAHPSDGIEGGGVGHCKLSTGQVIDATF
ncbi:MAG: hypothetical protein ACRETC_08360 [Gammaproteobacteria bacterium]